LQPTLELGRAILKHSSIWFCAGWGLQSFPGHPGNWCALTAPFHPYLAVISEIQNPLPGGMLSVALSFTLPRLHVMEHPALRRSDFPPDEHIQSGDRLVRFGRKNSDYLFGIHLAVSQTSSLIGFGPKPNQAYRIFSKS